jgi:hypothetical protein
MNFNVMGSLRVYLDLPRGGDPRTFLAVLYQGEERVHPFDARGAPTDEAPLAALVRSAEGARVMANETDRLWAGTYFGADPTRVLPLPPSEEARLRLLAGRARKALPPERSAPPPAPGRDDPLPDDLDALLSDAAEPAPAPIAEGLVPNVAVPDIDDLDVLFCDMWPDEPGPSEPSKAEGGRVLSDEISAALPPDLRTMIEERAAALKAAPVTGPVTGPDEADDLIGQDDLDPDAAGEPEKQLDVYPLLGDQWRGAMDWISRSFHPQWTHDEALSAILAEMHDLGQDSARLIRPGHHMLYGVRAREDILKPDRFVCLAWTQMAEGRLRLRLVRFNDSPDLRPHHARGMRLLSEHISRFEYGPVEALFPVSITVRPELMRAGGFEHLQDLPRWYWGADCALWVRKARI